MTTRINGVEITPKMADLLKRWYDFSGDNVEDSYPHLYHRWMSQVQDYLTRVWVNKNDEDEDIHDLKECVDMVIHIKDDFKILIPEKK